MGLIIGGIAIAIATALVAGALVMWVQKYSPGQRNEGYVDAIGMVFAVVGVLYAIVLAFVVLAVWDQMAQSREDTYAEATALVEVYEYAQNQPAIKDEAQSLISEYADRVIASEWPVMEQAQAVPLDDWVLLDRLGNVVEAAAPQANASDAAVSAYRAVQSDLDAVSTARQARIAAATRGLPTVMWFLLIGGGLLTIAFAYLFDIAGTIPQIIFTVGLTMMVVLLLFAVYQLEFPFSRAEHIGPDAFEYAKLRFAQLGSGN